MPECNRFRICIVNPNSNQTMTEGLKQSVEQLGYNNVRQRALFISSHCQRSDYPELTWSVRCNSRDGFRAFLGQGPHVFVTCFKSSRPHKHLYNEQS